MNQNYYEILEISKNASPEIVEKAYKTLAKKYHPDLQKNSLKKDSEEKLKQINEAYEVLSDTTKRKNYDAMLQQSKIETEQLTHTLLEENRILKNELSHLKSIFSQTNTNLSNKNLSNSKNDDFLYKNQIKYEQEQARKKAYYDAYIQDLKDRGYTIKYKKTMRDYLKSIVSILLTILILILISQLPFIKSFLYQLYQENVILQSILSFFKKLFGTVS